MFKKRLIAMALLSVVVLSGVYPKVEALEVTEEQVVEVSVDEEIKSDTVNVKTQVLQTEENTGVGAEKVNLTMLEVINSAEEVPTVTPEIGLEADEELLTSEVTPGVEVPNEVTPEPQVTPEVTPEVTPQVTVTPTPEVVNQDTAERVVHVVDIPNSEDYEIHLAYNKLNMLEEKRGVDFFVKINKEFVVARANEKINVREEQSLDSRLVGKLPEGGICFILANRFDEWVFIESQEVRGFVKSEYLDINDEVVESFKTSDEKDFDYAKALIPWYENEAFWHATSSVYAEEYNNDHRYLGVSGNFRNAIVDYAMQFVGNPYVWGGNSLTDGADCSGYVQTLYGLFGINLPRVSADQSVVGERVTLEEAKPGDLVFYYDEDGVYHVAIYRGNGNIVHAKGEKWGIVTDKINYSRNGYWICDVISDIYLKTMFYTEEEIELIWALVAQEDSTSYEGALGVISCVMNRVEENYGGYGESVLDQLTAPGQFCYDPAIGGDWQSRLDGNVEDFVKDAVKDCLDDGLRNHNFLNFRSTNANGKRVKIGENYYF